MTGFVDRERATQLMNRAGIEALILCAPEAFHYATGSWIGPAGLFRRAGAGFVVIPARHDLPIGIVVADFNAAQLQTVAPEAVVRAHPIWIESAPVETASQGLPLAERIEAGLATLARAPDFARPATFDLASSVRQLQAMLAEFGLGRATLGIDLDFVPAADFAAMQALLPDFSMIDGSAVLNRLRAIKSQREVDLLQQGIILSEAGLDRLRVDAMAGMRQADLIALYREGVAAAAAGLSHPVATAEYVTLGARAKGADAKALPGDPLKCDMVCTVGGHASDMSRNFTFGPPSADQADLHAIAERAFEDGLRHLCREIRSAMCTASPPTAWRAKACAPIAAAISGTASASRCSPNSGRSSRPTAMSRSRPAWCWPSRSRSTLTASPASTSRTNS